MSLFIVEIDAQVEACKMSLVIDLCQGTGQNLIVFDDLRFLIDESPISFLTKAAG